MALASTHLLKMMTPEEHAIQALRRDHQQSVHACFVALSLTQHIRNVDGGMEAAGCGRWRRLLSKDTTLKLPVLLARVTLVLFDCRHGYAVGIIVVGVASRRRRLQLCWWLRLDERHGALRETGVAELSTQLGRDFSQKSEDEESRESNKSEQSTTSN